MYEMKHLTSEFSPLQEIPTLFMPATDSDVMPTVSMVAKAPLRMPGQPYEYRKYSPTPLDPRLLGNASEGPLYEQAALDYMENMRDSYAVPELMSLDQALAWYDAHEHMMPHPTWVSMRREMMTQHELKTRRNDLAIRALRDIHTPICTEEIEELMQVRAGIASIPTMLKFLATYPQVGGIEIMKATRPGNREATLAARAALIEELETLTSPTLELEVDVRALQRLHIRPDAELADTPDPRIVVFKTHIARAAVVLADSVHNLEIIWRDSGVILDSRCDDDMSTAYMVGKSADGAARVYVAPISVTAYARLAPNASRVLE
jgi:hypothetical protein